MNEIDLISSIEELESQTLDVLIVGSGPAGVAVAERIHEKFLGLNVGIIERGAVLTLTHINNILDNKERRNFIEKFKLHPWEGDFKEGGMLIPFLGGRGIAAGAHLRRFDEDDYFVWSNGLWEKDLVDNMPEYYKDAEMTRRVSVSSITGPSQTWIHGALNQFNPHPPPIGVDLWSEKGFTMGKGYDSPAARLWKLLIEDALRAGKRHLFLTINAYCTKVEHNGSSVYGVECINTQNKKTHQIKAKAVVLSASAIESARICLSSGIGERLENTGRFLAEHIERRARIEVDVPIKGFTNHFVSMIVPPKNNDKRERFQVHLRGNQVSEEKLEIDIGGFAAMDPQHANCITLSSAKDEFGILKANTRISLSDDDMEREGYLCRQIKKIINILGGKPITERFPVEGTVPKFTDETRTIQKMDPGRSYHEVGTLRMGTNAGNSVTNSFGQVHGIQNLFVSDAALFPCVGVANPMLTITALAYRVADKAGEVCKQL